MIQLTWYFVLEGMFLTERVNDLIYQCACSVCQASANMVWVMAFLNVSQYTRMVSLTKDYVHIMTGPVFIFYHYPELMIIIYWFIAQFELAMPKMQKGKRRMVYKEQKTTSQHPNQVT